MYIKGDILGFSRLISIVFKASPKKCQISFFYHMSGSEFLTLSVGKQTVNSTVVPATVVWVMPGKIFYIIDFRMVVHFSLVLALVFCVYPFIHIHNLFILFNQKIKMSPLFSKYKCILIYPNRITIFI